MTIEISVTEVQSALDEYRENKSLEKLEELLKTYYIDDEGAELVAQFMYDLPASDRLEVWGFLQAKTKNLFALHPYIEDLMIATARGESTDHLDFEEVRDLRRGYKVIKHQ